MKSIEMELSYMKKFDNYVRQLNVFKKAYDEFIISGIIDKFSLQFELGWKVLKELLVYEGESRAKTGSPREILKASYAYFGFLDEDVWLSMLRDRNDTSHIYNGNQAKELARMILDRYIPAFIDLKVKIEENYEDVLNEL